MLVALSRPHPHQLVVLTKGEEGEKKKGTYVNSQASIEVKAPLRAETILSTRPSSPRLSATRSLIRSLSSPVKEGAECGYSGMKKKERAPTMKVTVPTVVRIHCCGRASGQMSERGKGQWRVS